MSERYVPLWCKTNFSFLEGASHPEELIAAWTNMRSGDDPIAFTDRDGVYGIVQAWSAARESGVSLLYGAEITLEDSSTVVAIALSREGYRNLCRLITVGRLRCEKGKSSVSALEVCEHNDGLIVLWGGRTSSLACSEQMPAYTGAFVDAFGDRLYALLARHQLDVEVGLESRLRERSSRLGLNLVAANEVLYHSAQKKRLQDVLTCIKHGVELEQAGRLLRANSAHALLSPSCFCALFEDEPAAIARTLEIAARASFTLEDLHYRYPSETRPDGTTSTEHLRNLTFEGARARYPDGIQDEARAQLERELELIEELDYGGYFLTMWEIVDYCRRNAILCQGRGSAANSLVCFCLGITAIDPLQMDLLFERFISRERAEPPDIDLDIAHEHREQVIQWVYEKYGRDRAAMVANVVRYRPRSAMRDVGRVLGIADASIDRAAKLLSSREPPTRDDIERVGLDLDSMRTKLLFELIDAILEFPRHLSIHPGGFLLGHEPVHDLVPIENASMPDRTVIQWSKYDVEALDLFKVDLLGLGALSHLKRSFDLIARHRNITIDMASIPPDDPETYAMLSRAESVGVFQVESRAQMSMLPRLKPRKFYDLVIEIGLVRPGPITGDMVHPYLRRRNGEEPVTYPHSSLKPILEKTLGIPLFQEQVMRLAVTAADYTPGEADQLRRDMAAWRSRGRIERHRNLMLERMQKKGIDMEFALGIFNQIRGFGEYGFPESHSASFALIAYATAYLRRHYPVEFVCGLLNAQPMGFYTPATIVDDAKRELGVRFLPVDVQASAWDCTMQPVGDTFAIRMGFRYLKGMSEAEWERLENARSERPFTSVRDFIRRAELRRNILHRCAESGAFDGFHITRRQALWLVQGFDSGTLPLPFETSSTAPSFGDLDPFETIAWDYQTTFHSPRGHPMQTVRDELESRDLPSAKRIKSMRHGSYLHYAALVICRQRPSTASGVIFMTLEDETGFVNLVIWPSVYEKYRILSKTQSFLGVSGRLERPDAVAHLIADHLWVPDISLRPSGAPSRDFR